MSTLIGSACLEYLIEKGWEAVSQWKGALLQISGPCPGWGEIATILDLFLTDLILYRNDVYTVLKVKQYFQSLASLVTQWLRKCLPMQEMWAQSLGQEDLLEEGMATHFSILAWKIPWTEEPEELQSLWSKKSET